MVTTLTPSNLGINLFQETDPIQLLPNASSEEIEIIILAVYRQVLGNVHLMESERLTSAESQLTSGEITIAEFVRQVALSDLYRQRFFENSSQLRFIELNFKHLLGRAPESHEELVEHVKILAEEGYIAEINSYLGSNEYLDAFGESVVPYYRDYKTSQGRKLVGFTHLFQLLRGACSSDLSTETDHFSLQTSLLKNLPSRITPLKELSPTPGRFARSTSDTRALVSSVLGLKNYSANNFPINSPAVTSESVIESQFNLGQQRQFQSFRLEEPVELVVGSSETDYEVAIRATYRQVLGNAHIMESERLTVPESQFKRGELSVREFVRQIAKSELYRSRFFDNCPRYRAIELNFKHLLGRAPDDYSETFIHSQILDQSGFETEIDWYLDSDEYQNNFGENIVPYYRGYKSQTGRKLLGFTNAFKLNKSLSTSDKAGIEGNRARLARPLIYNNPSGNVPVVDIKKLLATTLSSRPTVPSKVSITDVSISALEQQEKEQNAIIQTLEKQLAELRPLASFGSQKFSTWQSVNPDATNQSISATSLDRFSATNTLSSLSLQQRVDAQSKKIASLKAKLDDSRRWAAFSETQLNKWQRNSYSIR